MLARHLTDRRLVAKTVPLPCLVVAHFPTTMRPYVPPFADIAFVVRDLLEADGTLRQLPGYSDCDADTLMSISEEIGKFASDVLHPINAVGDLQGCRREADGSVRTPDGFKEAFAAFAAGGWSGLACDPKYGGQGLPTLLNTVLYEMLGATNLAWAGYPGLSHAAYACIEHNGSDEQKAVYLPPLTAGRWSGTMCLTEPQCGSDLGLLKTRASPHVDGSHRLSGTKIFISSGEHDLTENIIHLVLARIDGAPERTKGISLFVVPKFLPIADGAVGARNPIHCGSLEQKMGIRGNATCELVLDGAQGWLVGKPNGGLQAMFVMMNAARVGVGVQAVGISDYAYQCSKAYALERLQFRAPSRAAHPELPADPIVWQPDVQRLLLTQRAYAEGGRALAYWTALLLDEGERHPDPVKRRDAAALAALLTPIVKAFLSDNACECASHAVQVHGGHGYICETGVEQYLRDARITPIYEGTNGIQALDLLSRKVIADDGRVLKAYLQQIETLASDASGHEAVDSLSAGLTSLVNRVRTATTVVISAAQANAGAIGTASHAFMRVMGHLTLAYLWLRMARISARCLEDKNDAFHAAKLSTAKFYFDWLFPEVETHMAALCALPERGLAPLEHLV